MMLTLYYKGKRIDFRIAENDVDIVWKDLFGKNSEEYRNSVRADTHTHTLSLTHPTTYSYHFISFISPLHTHTHYPHPNHVRFATLCSSRSDVTNSTHSTHGGILRHLSRRCHSTETSS